MPITHKCCANKSNYLTKEHTNLSQDVVSSLVRNWPLFRQLMPINELWLSQTNGKFLDVGSFDLG